MGTLEPIALSPRDAAQFFCSASAHCRASLARTRSQHERTANERLWTWRR